MATTLRSPRTRGATASPSCLTTIEPGMATKLPSYVPAGLHQVRMAAISGVAPPWCHRPSRGAIHHLQTSSGLPYFWKRPRQSPHRLMPRSTPSGDQPLAADSPAAGVERQNERALGYTLLTVMLGALGLCQVALPQHFVEIVYLATPTLVTQGLLRLLGGTCLLAALVTNCLKEAAEHDRLRSDTYQRLNLGIMWWGLGTLAVAWLAPVQPRPVAQGAFTALMGGAALLAGATYHATSPEGLSPPFLLARLLESAGATWDTTSLSTAAYGGGALLTGLGAVAVLVGKLPVLQAPALAAPLGTMGYLFLRLQGVGMLLACIVYYTLKDAAARGRLGASTFKSLNAGIALVCLNNLVVLSSWIRTCLVQLHGLRSPVVVVSAALLLVSLWNYFTAKK